MLIMALKPVFPKDESCAGVVAMTGVVAMGVGKVGGMGIGDMGAVVARGTGHEVPGDSRQTKSFRLIVKKPGTLQLAIFRMTHAFSE